MLKEALERVAMALRVRWEGYGSSMPRLAHLVDSLQGFCVGGADADAVGASGAATGASTDAVGAAAAHVLLNGIHTAPAIPWALLLNYSQVDALEPVPPELHAALVFAAHAVEAAKCLQAGRLMYLVCAHAPEPEIRAYGLLFLTKAWTHTNTYTDWEIFDYIECFTDALKRPGAWGRHVDWDWSHVAAVLRTLVLRMQRDKNCTTVTDILRCMCVMLDSVHAQGLCACLCAADVVPGGGSHCKCSTVALEWAQVPGPLLGSCCFLTSSNSDSDNSVLTPITPAPPPRGVACFCRPLSASKLIQKISLG